MRFSARSVRDNRPLNPATVFQNPVGELYVTYSYDKMVINSQWTALWYRLEDGKLLCYKTKPWDGSTGGYGFTSCNPPTGEWLPGEYEVQFYVAETWKNSGRFTVTGEPVLPTETATATATRTSTATQTRTPTRTITPIPTRTKTLPPTSTMPPTNTPRPTDTRWPTLTPRN